MKRIIALLTALLFAAACICGCANSGDSETLSSADDFRENSILGPQHIDIETYTLTVDGLVDRPMEYTYDQVLDHTPDTRIIALHCVEGWSVNIQWEGIRLADLFEEAGVQDGANTVIFHAYDGYTTSLPLPYILDNDIMIAYKMNSAVLRDDRGFPFQVVAEGKLGYKWAKWVTRIELSDDEDYEGYWETWGYSNEADI